MAVSERIVVKGIVDRENISGLIIKNAVDGAAALSSGFRQDIERAISSSAAVVGVIEAAQRMSAEADRIKASFTDGLTVEAARVQMQIDDVRRTANGAMRVSYAEAATRVQDQLNYARVKAQEITGFGAAQAAALLTAQNAAVQYILEHRRLLSESISALVSDAYAVEMEHARTAIGLRDIAAQIAVVAQSFRYPQEFSVDPVVADMFVIFGQDAPKHERDAALERIALWFIRQRLGGHRLRTILRRLDASVIQGAILLVIDSDEFRKMTPREVKDKMPGLVYRALGERPTIDSEKGHPVYKWKRREAEWSDEIAGTENNTLDALVAVEDVVELQRLLQRVRLTRGEREVIDLLCIADLTVREAARKCGVTPNAVHQQRIRASKKIDRYLRAQRRRLRR